jgi:hypothetical protein
MMKGVVTSRVSVKIIRGGVPLFGTFPEVKQSDGLEAQ